ncbi:hypothetical protein [Paludifilum halophilum]|uniref:Uncharacterized protein n=1 Tax=Paludifilum halophilum TaxID=1642702 RepID=A0A235BC70_9BACL|nr:hypothetical protein [Paludifilum halophilum]OYD09883.1 hypothetical protein CHM34_02590 [Paludifilum halophilum]
MIVENRQYSELKEILSSIDWSVQALLRIEAEDKGEVLKVCSRVQDLQDVVHRRDLARRYPHVHEVVSFLYLCCFSLLHLRGESFFTYRDEMKQRYKTLLRSLYFFPNQYFAAETKRISNL